MPTRKETFEKQSGLQQFFTVLGELGAGLEGKASPLDTQIKAAAESVDNNLRSVQQKLKITAQFTKLLAPIDDPQQRQAAATELAKTLGGGQEIQNIAQGVANTPTAAATEQITRAGLTAKSAAIIEGVRRAFEDKEEPLGTSPGETSERDDVTTQTRKLAQEKIGQLNSTTLMGKLLPFVGEGPDKILTVKEARLLRDDPLLMEDLFGVKSRASRIQQQKAADARVPISEVAPRAAAQAGGTGVGAAAAQQKTLPQDVERKKQLTAAGQTPSAGKTFILTGKKSFGGIEPGIPFTGQLNPNTGRIETIRSDGVRVKIPSGLVAAGNITGAPQDFGVGLTRSQKGDLIKSAALSASLMNQISRQLKRSLKAGAGGAGLRAQIAETTGGLVSQFSPAAGDVLSEFVSGLSVSELATLRTSARTLFGAVTRPIISETGKITDTERAISEKVIPLTKITASMQQIIPGLKSVYMLTLIARDRDAFTANGAFPVPLTDPQNNSVNKENGLAFFRDLLNKGFTEKEAIEAYRNAVSAQNELLILFRADK